MSFKPKILIEHSNEFENLAQVYVELKADTARNSCDTKSPIKPVIISDTTEINLPNHIEGENSNGFDTIRESEVSNLDSKNKDLPKISEFKNNHKNIYRNKEFLNGGKESDEDVFICSNKVQALSIQISKTILYLNIFLPGVGTILCGYHQGKNANDNKNHSILCSLVCYGLAQILLAPIIVGWVLSIIFGIQIYKQSQFYSSQIEHEKSLNTEGNEKFVIEKTLENDEKRQYEIDNYKTPDSHIRSIVDEKISDKDKSLYDKFEYNISKAIKKKGFSGFKKEIIDTDYSDELKTEIFKIINKKEMLES